MRGVILPILFGLLIAGLGSLWVLRSGAGRTGGAVLIGFNHPFLTSWRALEEQIRDRVPYGRTTVRRRLREQQEQLDRQALELDRLRSVQAENRQLRTFLDLPPMPGWRCVTARVVARDPVTWNRTFRIDKGQRDGIAVNAAVLAGQYVIGRISDCDYRTATVVTIADPSARLSVVVGPRRAPGILSGGEVQERRQKVECLADFLPVDAEFAAGDAVVSAGLGLGIPAGLPVGRVATAPGRPAAQLVDGVYVRLRVEPLGDIAGARCVAVVCSVALERNAPIRAGE